MKLAVGFGLSGARHAALLRAAHLTPDRTPTCGPVVPPPSLRPGRSRLRRPPSEARHNGHAIPRTHRVFVGLPKFLSVSPSLVTTWTRNLTHRKGTTRKMQAQRRFAGRKGCLEEPEPGLAPTIRPVLSPTNAGWAVRPGAGAGVKVVRINARGVQPSTSRIRVASTARRGATLVSIAVRQPRSASMRRNVDSGVDFFASTVIWGVRSWLTKAAPE